MQKDERVFPRLHGNLVEYIGMVPMKGLPGRINGTGGIIGPRITDDRPSCGEAALFLQGKGGVFFIPAMVTAAQEAPG